MSDLHEAAALLVLLREGNAASLTAQALLDAGSARNLLIEHAARPSQHALFDDQPVHLAERRARELENAAAEIEHLSNTGVRLISALDIGYPDRLHRLPGAPAALFVQGSRSWTDGPTVAVIGSRTADDAEQQRAGLVASHLAKAGYTIASGLAAGVDAAAHEATLDVGGSTVAVLGTGILRSYPPRNAGLQRRIAARGTLVSQFLPEAPPSKETFPRRNAVMSGIAQANVIIAAGTRSGARLQARLGLAQGRPALFHTEMANQDWVAAMLEHELADTFASSEDLLARLQQVIEG